MTLGTHYYRAPFPQSGYWENDFKKIRESGLNTVQIWVSWGWAEATPDKFCWDDYDRLVELAAKHKLGVILSTIAEVQPNWIHRVIPGSELVDNFGRKVISCARCEHHFGLTPGGCTDHPEVWTRMARFIRETGRRYASLHHLRGWDIWNELRWNVHADGLVCYCSHTLAAFRKWLEQRFGSLDGLNAAWKRRYASWDDVQPGKLPDRVYTEMMAFQHFLTCRADTHAAARYDVMREVDRTHVITAHGARPTALYGGDAATFALDRGNDWNLAGKLDGVGCSSFPTWGNIDDADFGLRIDMVKSAARGKKVWLSELQGGRSAVGFNVYDEVHAAQQQRWVWNGIACGADTVLFWCWRDEIFGRETGGFGLDGADGFAGERLAATKVTGNLLEEHAALFDSYIPHRAETGILFSPQSYYLAWSQDGSAARVMDALTAYGRALTRRSSPVTCVEETHLDALDSLKVLFCPRLLVTDAATEDALLRFVERGGTLVVESECGAFNSAGFYRAPEERFLARAGVEEIGRRPLPSPPASTAGAGTVFHYNGKTHDAGASQWLTPLKNAGGGLCSVREHGKGRVIHFATYPGNAWRERWNAGFENLLTAIVAGAGVVPPARVRSPAPDEKNFVYLKSGRAGNGDDILFVFFPENTDSAEIALAPDLFPGNRVREIFSGATAVVDTASGIRRLVATPARFNLALYTDAGVAPDAAPRTACIKKNA
ncbi:beta-galactosidase [Geminisphaera colitermitum]|uniref:beta-galactosidase n=1 Tax=Geminisphaera colitermitum TaxID=1148786 RepID=UPI000158C839|nr:alpha-amylase family protein [Geminisphaera colitermitum]